MADRIVLLSRGDETRAQEIIDSFAEQTGLEPTEIDGGAEFPLGPDDHDVDVVETLNEIDDSWPDHLELGDPAGES